MAVITLQELDNQNPTADYMVAELVAELDDAAWLDKVRRLQKHNARLRTESLNYKFINKGV